MEPLKQFGRRAQIRGSMALLLACALIALARPAEASSQLNPACPLQFFTAAADKLLRGSTTEWFEQSPSNYVQTYYGITGNSYTNINGVNVTNIGFLGQTNQIPSFGITNIPVYVNGSFVYTPAVNRLLQVTANILDATTTNYYPSVFRPIFYKAVERNYFLNQLFTNVYIRGYQYVQEPLASNNPPILNTPMDVNDARVPFGLSGMTNNIYGIPWVIGVKKGLPNFNELELDNCFFIERELQFNRNSSAPAAPGTAFPYGRIYTTNQMYVMGVSNLIGVDDWNSYAENYTNQVTIVAQDALSVTLTNDAGFSIGNFFYTNTVATTNSWPGYSFLLPFGTNMTVAQNLSFTPSPPSAYGTYLYYYTPRQLSFGGFDFTGPCFIPQSLDTSNFLDQGTPPLPHFGLTVTNRLQAYIIDVNNCILDYVQLAPANSSLDVSSAIADPNSGTVPGDTAGLWSTNYYSDSDTPSGVLEQYLVSIGGPFPIEDSDEGVRSQQTGWTTAPIPGLGNDNSPAAQQAYFSAFFSAGDYAFYDDSYITNISYSIPAPFTPIRLIVQRTVYAANDPLVHYMSSDLNDFSNDTVNRRSLSLPPPAITSMGQLSDRYMPWGSEYPGEQFLNEPPVNVMTSFNGIPVDNNQYNLAYKDPAVWSSDDWNFPTNQILSASWLGQVHRGTPWQTIFLKSTNILELQSTFPGTGVFTWVEWTGDTNLADAVFMAPAQDWAIAGLLASLFNTNNEASLFSANDPNPNDWENVLNGMTAVTNDLPDQVLSFDPTPEFATLTISSNSTQAAEIANAIEVTRAASPRQLFITPGDIFAVPQLSVQSPFLNWNDPAQEQAGISDQAYEAIPGQLLPLLRVDSIGSMAPANGQVIIQFTGDDNHVYAIQSSPNLVNWTTISTNCPVNGTVTFTNNAGANAQFYRTILLY